MQLYLYHHQLLSFLTRFKAKAGGEGIHTGSILAPADLDELLDVADFARHAGRVVGAEGSGYWFADGYRFEAREIFPVRCRVLVVRYRRSGS